MQFAGKVTSKTENVEGHSQVRISGTVTLADGSKHAAEIIISTPSTALVGAFTTGEDKTVSL